MKTILKPTSKTDLYINIPITKDIYIPDYIDIQRTGPITINERQNINPYYIDFKFFDDTDNFNDITTKANLKNITINL